ncbi:DNA mismatch repair protein MSH7 [Euphorbia peplus]|nr:DNA mismatch repair protein MSH7 [Euphorbia peplus]
MQRQKSILSFFPPPAKQNSGTGDALNARGPSQSTAKKSESDIDGSMEEIRGTDTPPEKVPRQILPGTFTAVDSKGSSLFSSIMHKFVKVDDKEKPAERKQEHQTSADFCLVSGRAVNSNRLNKNETCLLYSEKNKVITSNGKTDNGAFLVDESDDDVPGPETPGVQHVVPRFKRVLEDIPKFDCNFDWGMNASKKIKVIDSTTSSKKQGQVCDSTNKFEWLDPLQIRDANGRRPKDPLYDKKTLYIPPDALKKMSASQKQYWTIKSQYMDVVVFFKVGKFYELYELDAEIGHKELDWKMTISGVGKCRQVGISESGIDDAVEKLVARGYKVGRIEQLETSDQAKARGGNTVIQRKLIQVTTPSTVTDGNIGPDAVHLLAIKEGNSGVENQATVYGFAFLDCASLRFWVGSVVDDASFAALGALLMQVSPKEVLYESRGMSKEALKALKKYSFTGSTALQLTPVQPSSDFLDTSGVRKLIQSKGYFKGSSNTWDDALDSISHNDVALSALGGLIDHLSRMMLHDVLQNGDISPYQVYRGCLRMDGQTFINLEIFNNNHDGGLSGTLFKYLDNCVTSSGKRLLRKWICHPLKCIEGINNRLNVVEALMVHSEIMLLIAQYLRKLPDLERMLGRVKASSQASASLVLPLIGKKLLKQRVKVFGSLVKGLRIGIDLLMLLQKEGQIISLLLKTFKLPELNGSAGLDKFLVQFEAAIDSEFPNYQNHNVTESEAETLTVLMELFTEKVKQWCEVINAINCIDVLRSFAITSSMSSGSMSRPVILPESKTTSSQDPRAPVLKVKGLWHPFALGESGGQPVPNDLYLGEDQDGYHPRTLLLTGPNMGGKSTLLRATCLTVILAQLGCFVPSESCVLSLVDVIFTRLGATDRIMTGESTFFIECTETASVLQKATQDSLVLLDELGRGTSTFDGYAIAYAVFRHLVEQVNCRLLFATHYHPLTKEFASHPHVTLQHMACAFESKPGTHSKHDRNLVFLYRLASGGCPASYGLQVAVMAGIPEKVVEAASDAGKMMEKTIGESFKTSERRSDFSTLHENWFTALLSAAQIGDCVANGEDEDAYDTLFCLWHEIKSSYQSNQIK